MRIVVVSDTHGDSHSLREVICREGHFGLLIHLGDGERDTGNISDVLGNIPLLQVCGNCDFASDLPDRILTTEGGKTLFLTHGHKQMVKYGTAVLRKEALEQNADIALYGHTHVPVQTYDEGIYLCNPGSLRQGDYAVLEIRPNGILWTAKRIF